MIKKMFLSRLFDWVYFQDLCEKSDDVLGYIYVDI